MSSVYRHQKNHQPQTFPLNKKRIPLPNYITTTEKENDFYFKLVIIIYNLSQKVNHFYQKSCHHMHSIFHFRKIFHNLIISFIPKV